MVTEKFRHHIFSSSFLLLSCLLFFFGATRSLALSKDIINGERGRAAILYDNDDGMPTSEANAIAQTSDGFLWIGSYSGLICYDGSTFYRFDSSIGISSVVCLFVDSKDRLWIGTNDSGVACYNNGTFSFFTKKDGLSSSSIRSIQEDKDGNILIATTQGLAYVDTANMLHIIDDSQLNSEYISSLYADAKGIVYGVTIDGALFKLDENRIGSFVNVKKSGVESINCVCTDENNEGYVYLGTKNSIVYGNIENGFEDAKIIKTDPLFSVNKLAYIDDYIWVCTDNGIAHLDKDFNLNTLKNIPMNNSIDDAIEDHEGNLWFASSRQGVMKIVPDQFTDISERAGLKTAVMNSTCMYNGKLYIGSDNGLIILDETYKTFNDDLTKLLEGVRIRCIFRDKDNNLWISTYDGEHGLVCQEKDGKITQFTEKEGLLSNWVRSTVQLNNGDIAVSASGGINIISNGKVTKKYNKDDGINNGEILSICETKDGTLYLGSDGDGIYVLKNNTLSRIGLEDGLTSEVILRIRYDTKNDVYWIITSNSICYMKDGNITNISNFPYTNNFDLFFDNKDNIWVLSSNGIYLAQTAKLMQNNKDTEYTHYDSSTGLTCVATANSWSELTEDGDLFIAGTTGISCVNINNIEDDTKAVRLTVPYVTADDENIYPDEDGSVTVPANCQRLTINNYAITYSLKNPIIVYWLEGFDDTRFSTDKHNLAPVSYTNLTGGDYVFHMALLNNHGEIQNEYVMNITKEKRIYEQVYFIIPALLIIIGVLCLAIYAYMKHKTRILEKKEQDKQKTLDQVISAFAKLIDAKDKYTNGHSFRVANYTKKLAKKLNKDDSEVEKYYNLALLHDIGKIAIPDSILNKPEGLTDDEYELMKSHASKGYEVLKEIVMEPELADGAKYHHERFDGKGYPSGLKGDEIPEVAQIIAVADTFDAMYSTRPYRKKLPLKVVVDEIKGISGTQLSPVVVEAFVELADEGSFGDLEKD